MQKKILIVYFAIIATLLIMMSLSRQASDKVRGQSVALFSPLMENILSFKFFLLHPFTPSPFNQFSIEEEKQQLQLENQLLEIEISYLQEQLHEQLLISSQIGQLAPLLTDETKQLANENEKGLQNAFKTTQKRVEAIPARVFFRSLDTWNSALWINVGEETNRKLDTPTIAKNSPVVIGKAIVGIIDYVDKHQSRVRLISDQRLTPSVRAARGGEQDFLLGEQIEGLLHQISYKKNLPISIEDQTLLFNLLRQLKHSLQPFKKSVYLAKGKLLGSIASARLGQEILLNGIGFNYDFADNEGENRDLRNGKSLHNPQAEAISLLKVNDILVTTGMDGIFPPGFQVATITQIQSLKEGDFYYNLEARPIVRPLEELSLVFVLPPFKLEP